MTGQVAARITSGSMVRVSRLLSLLILAALAAPKLASTAHSVGKGGCKPYQGSCWTSFVDALCQVANLWSHAPQR